MTSHPQLRLHETGIGRLSADQCFARAVEIVERSGLLGHLQPALTAKAGPRRRLSPYALMVGMQMHALIGGNPMHLSQVRDTIAAMSPLQRSTLGLRIAPTYRQVEDLFTSLTNVLDQDPPIEMTPHNHPPSASVSCPASCEYAALDAASFANAIITGSLPDDCAASTGAVAIDSSHYETHARRQCWSNTPDTDADCLPPDRVKAGKEFRQRAWPRRGHDGRAQQSLDQDARSGWHSGTNGEDGEVFLGWDVHIATDVPRFGAETGPHLIRGFLLTAAGSNKAVAGIRLIDAIRRRHCLDEVIVDRGYSYCRVERWAYPLAERGIQGVIDLHKKQRGRHPGPHPGTIWIDGTLFSDCLPDYLRDLPRPPERWNSNLAERSQHRDRYDERASWAFTAMTAPDQNGARRYKGPALAGHVRSPNHPRSLRLPYDRPTSECSRKQFCGCGVTVTIRQEDAAWTKQRTPWGTLAWWADYGRRPAVESTNSQMRYQRAHLHRHYTRVFGTVKNTVLLAFRLAADNILTLRDWHARRRLSDPWGRLLGEPEHTFPSRSSRSPKARPLALHQRYSGLHRRPRAKPAPPH